jgi:predicted tellurium resistance membrane protein TerC
MLQELLTIDGFLTLLMLVALQAVLGFDNLLYISLESKRAPLSQQAAVRRIGIGIAILLRIILLFVLLNLVDYVKGSFWVVSYPGFIEFDLSFHAFIVLIGGIFIMYTAVKEIFHMMSFDMEAVQERASTSASKVIFWIVLMNLVFSFDSILSAMALSDVFIIMALAIVIGGILMIVLADTVSEFIEKNRKYEVLGLFVLFVVGILLISEGGHLAHLILMDNPVHAMSKATFYFVVIILVAIDIVQSRYQQKILLVSQAKKKSL